MRDVRILERKEEALQDVREWFMGLPAQTRTLTPVDLSVYQPRKVSLGFRVGIDFSDGITRRLDILCEENFPWKPPGVALVDRPDFLTWPHVEEDGGLCLFPQSVEFNSFSPSALVQHTVSEACELIERLLAGGGDEDFRSEFLTYWARAAGRFRKLQLLSTLTSESRLLRLHRRRGCDYLADGDSTIENWLKNRGLKFDDQCISTPAMLLWLDRPLIPQEFPTTARDVSDLSELFDSQAHSSLTELCDTSPEGLMVVLAMPTANGPCFAGTKISLPAVPFHKGTRWSQPSREEITNRGFRPGKAPRAIVASRLLGDAPVEKSVVERADPSWLYGRDRDKRFDSLREASVLILGCGSVGANVAVLLAQAGVGELHLVDPEELAWANITRHPLGADFVGKSKSMSLAECLRRSHPHTTVQAHDSTWQDVVKNQADILEKHSASVCAIGDWAAESMLNEFHVHSGRTRPVVYGWTEAHACAGHAVMVRSDTGCLHCGFSPTGQARLQVTAWSESTIVNEPACGATFQPYGPVELNGIVSLVAEATLDSILDTSNCSSHRIWAGREQHLHRASGSWTAEWTALVGKGDYMGSRTIERDWTREMSCPVCGAVSRD